MMMVLEAHKQQQQQEQEREQELQAAAATGAKVVTVARGSDAGAAGAAAADSRLLGVQHTSVNRLFAAADDTQAAVGIPSRRSMEDAASAARNERTASAQ
jgi:hypothetical protein